MMCHHLNFWVLGLTAGAAEGRCQVAGSICAPPHPRCELAGQTTGPQQPRRQHSWSLPASAWARRGHPLSSPHPVGGAFLPLLFGRWGVDFLSQRCFPTALSFPLTFPPTPLPCASVLPGRTREPGWDLCPGGQISGWVSGLLSPKKTGTAARGSCCFH